MPRKIRDILADYRKAGFRVTKGGKVDHRKSRHENHPGAVIVDGEEGADCKPYQEKDLQKAQAKLKSQ